MRLVHRQSNALTLYLTAVYVAHQEVKPGSAFVNNRRNSVAKEGRASWIRLAGMTAPKEIRARRARLRRALDGVVGAGLANIDNPGARGRYEEWALLSDNGTGAVYRVPSERDPAAVRLPSSFFHNGWHLVLTPGEIAMLLIIMHRGRWTGTDMDRELWVSLRRWEQASTYGLSGEMYLHAQQLWEFGLVEFFDPMPNRRRGKIKGMPSRKNALPGEATKSGDGSSEPRFKPVPYRYRAAGIGVFDNDAFEVVRRTLTALPIPHRLDSEARGIAPQDYVTARMQARVAPRLR